MTTWGQLIAGRLAPEVQERMIAEAAQQLKGLPLGILRDREQLRRRAQGVLVNVAAREGVALSPDMMVTLINRLVAGVGGLGFLNDLLPPVRDDLTDIAVTPDGKVWVVRRGERFFEPVDALRPTKEEVFRTVEALLAPLGRALTEATPSVDARLPNLVGRIGARIKVQHPVIAPGEGYPSITIRLYEPRPVTLAQEAAWGLAPEGVLRGLAALVGRTYRLLIIGGTGTGKTTLLSALANEGIPPQVRVVVVEDPQEIYLDHPHVVSLEARKAPPGSDVPPYTVKDGVDDALRMAPQWIIVGEVRTGDAAMALFRAQMSDHAGLTTFHAESPEKAVKRLAVIMASDIRVEPEVAREIFFQAVDVVVQVGWREGQRRLVGVWETEENGGFRPLYRPGDESLAAVRKERVL